MRIASMGRMRRRGKIGILGMTKRLHKRNGSETAHSFIQNCSERENLSRKRKRVRTRLRKITPIETAKETVWSFQTNRARGNNAPVNRLKKRSIRLTPI